jgi:hypothetical protein
MKKLFVFLAAVVGLAVGFVGCSASGKYAVTCMTLFGPLQLELDGSKIGGLSNPLATTYTIQLENGAEATISKGQCIVIKAPATKADAEAPAAAPSGSAGE